MSFLSLYLITRAIALHDALEPTIGILTISLIISTIAYVAVSSDGKDAKVQKSWFKYSAIGVALSFILLIVTPTDKDVAIILGGYYVSNNEDIKALPDNVVKTANVFLKNYIEHVQEHPKQ